MAFGARGCHWVELGGCFVEHDDRRVEAHEACECQLLRANGRDVMIAEADRGIESRG